jgi:hypothetical protein
VGHRQVTSTCDLQNQTADTFDPIPASADQPIPPHLAGYDGQAIGRTLDGDTNEQVDFGDHALRPFRLLGSGRVSPGHHRGVRRPLRRAHSTGTTMSQAEPHPTHAASKSRSRFASGALESASDILGSASAGVLVAGLVGPYIAALSNPGMASKSILEVTVTAILFAVTAGLGAVMLRGLSYALAHDPPELKHAAKQRTAAEPPVETVS